MLQPRTLKNKYPTSRNPHRPPFASLRAGKLQAAIEVVLPDQNPPPSPLRAKGPCGCVSNWGQEGAPKRWLAFGFLLSQPETEKGPQKQTHVSGQTSKLVGVLSGDESEKRSATSRFRASVPMHFPLTPPPTRKSEKRKKATVPSCPKPFPKPKATVRQSPCPASAVGSAHPAGGLKALGKTPRQPDLCPKKTISYGYGSKSSNQELDRRFFSPWGGYPAFYPHPYRKKHSEPKAESKWPFLSASTVGV